jgi:hypothetical protein
MPHTKQAKLVKTVNVRRFVIRGIIEQGKLQGYNEAGSATANGSTTYYGVFNAMLFTTRRLSVCLSLSNLPTSVSSMPTFYGRSVSRQ